DPPLPLPDRIFSALGRACGDGERRSGGFFSPLIKGSGSGNGDKGRRSDRCSERRWGDSHPPQL
ncbi:MAG TPA: hypothetical protein VIK64_10085, partial [Anaerolineales bacterium]